MYLGQLGWVFFRILTSLSKVLEVSLREIEIFVLRDLGAGERVDGTSLGEDLQVR